MIGSQRQNIAGAYVWGGSLGARAPPPPPPGKKVPLRNVQKRKESSAQISQQKRMCTFRSDTTKLKQKKLFVGNRITIIVVWEKNKLVILAFMFVFIVYRTVSNVFERLFRPSETGPSV